MSSGTGVFLFIVGVMVFVVNAWLWQYNINTFRGRERDGVAFMPCLFLSFVPALGQLAIPGALLCFIVRLINGGDERQVTTESSNIYLLEISGTSKIKNPSTENIRNAVLSLTNDSDSFLVLSQGDLTYMQVVGDQNSGFELEFQEGDTDRHYRAKREMTTDEVVAAMTSYISGSQEWKKMADWEWMKI